MLRTSLLLLCLIGLSELPVHAQTDDTCTAIVEAALEAIDTLCAATGRNQVCYGHHLLDAQPQSTTISLNFNQPGDIAAASDIKMLTLSPFDGDAGIWGVSVMKLQANLPDTLPGQNVTFLLVGDVSLTTPETPPDIPVTVAGNSTINVRKGPSTSHPVASTLVGGTIVQANGRNAAGDWLRVTLPDNAGEGWIAAFLMEFGADATVLPVIETDNQPQNTIQAFYLQTGVGDAPCADAPESGVMIQTPAGAGMVQIRINEVDIVLGSTAFLQAQPGGVFSITLVEGQSYITALGITRFLPARAVVTVPLDDQLHPIGPPDSVLPYAENLIQDALVNTLPETVEITAPLTNSEIRQATNAIAIKYDLNACELVDTQTIHAGQIVYIFKGIGDWPSAEEAEADLSRQTITITADGVPLSVQLGQRSLDGSVSPGLWEFQNQDGETRYLQAASASWIATPGTHTLAGRWSPGLPWTTASTCVVIVAE